MTDLRAAFVRLEAAVPTHYRERMSTRALRAARGALPLALLAAAPGCKEAFDFVPFSVAEVRAGAQRITPQTGGSVTMHDEKGAAHSVPGNTPLEARGPDGSPIQAAGTANVDLDEIARRCLSPAYGVPPCPLDNASTTTWLAQFRANHDVLDWDAVGTIAEVSGVLLFLGGWIGVNIACYGTDVCSSGTKQAVGVTNDILVPTVLVVAFVGWLVSHSPKPIP